MTKVSFYKISDFETQIGQAIKKRASFSPDLVKQINDCLKTEKPGRGTFDRSQFIFEQQSFRALKAFTVSLPTDQTPDSLVTMIENTQDENAAYKLFCKLCTVLIKDPSKSQQLSSHLDKLNPRSTKIWLQTAIDISAIATKI